MEDHEESWEVVRAGRERGILSERDRQYLLDESEVESGSAHERMIRKDVRDRLTEALRDFRLLLEHMPDKDRRQVGEKLLESGGQLDRQLADGVAFLYLMAADHPEFDFATVCKRGIHAGALEAGHSVHSLQIDIEAHPAELADLREKLEGGERISLPDFQRLLRTEAFPTLEADLRRASFHLELENEIEDATEITIRLERE